jgi:hypothetical protein
MSGAAAGAATAAATAAAAAAAAEAAGAAETAAAWLLQQFSVWCALPMLCLLLALQCCITDVVEVSKLC